MQCPGQDTMFWKKEDVFEVACPKCNYAVEFFKYDVKRKCRCGHEMVNPKIDFGCALWCSYGEHCIEELPEEVRVKQKEEQNKRLRERVVQEMKRYFGQDQRRVDHALKVARYAEDLLKIEGGHPLVVFGAAYLHETGANSALEKYGSESFQFQAKESSSIAREILKKLNLSKKIADEICEIIAHQHHPGEKETLNFQIFSDAKSLATMDNGGGGEIPGNRVAVNGRVFKTVTGKRMAKELHGQA